MPLAVPFSAPSINIVSWPDRVTDAVGHDPRSPYVERFWLPVLGPSTVWLVRRIVAELDHIPEGFELHLADTAKALGLANNPGRNGPFVGAMIRMVQFGAAQYVPGGLAVRRRLPFLPTRHIDRLPPALQAEHHQWVTADERGNAQSQRRRAFSLALTLLRLDETTDEVIWQLEQWRFPPPLCTEAVDWAVEQLGPARPPAQEPFEAA